MRKSAWYVILGAAVLAVAAAGCGDDDGVIEFDAGPGSDSGMPGDASVPPDAPDAGPTACGTPGNVGGRCRTGMCGRGLECTMGLGTTAAEGFGARQAEATDSTNSEFRHVMTPVAANDVPVRFLAGDMCVQQCDLAEDTDSCGACARCSGSVGNDVLGLPPSWWFSRVYENAAYGDDTGLCRSTCDFDANSRGGCPEGYTCDPFTNICLEGCVSDAQCNAVFVLTEDGDFGTWVVPDGGRTCSATTGRCEWTQADTTTVGNACDSSNDCTEDVGICLRGGTCAETQCATASDTDATTGICDGGAGICLPAGGNDGSVCVQGCATSDDCNPGNACQPLINSMTGEPAMIGPFGGYCLGACDTVDSSTASVEDVIVNCGTHGGVVEQCDMPAATAEEPDPDGTCRATCNPLAEPGETGSCEADELCESVEGTSYGFCRPLNGFCFNPGPDECYGGQICNNALGAAPYGRCVTPCDPAADPSSCAGGDVCIDDAASALNGLCATPCTTGAGDAGVGDAGVGGVCGTGRTCQVPAGMSSGYCVEM